MNLTVTNSAELIQAMEKLATGEGGTIFLKNAGETYTALLNDAGGNEPAITLMSFDPNDPAVIEQMEFSGRENITLDGLVFDSSGAAATRHILTTDLSVSSSSNITVKNSIFKGDATGLFSGGGDVEQATSMATIRNSTGFTFENNVVSGYYQGLAILETVGVIVKNNEISRMQGDGLRLGGVQNVLIENNFMHDFYGSTGDINHMDMIQFWGTNTVLRTENVVIRGNILDAGNGTATQGIFGRNEEYATAADRYRNILIEDNLIHNGFYKGISMSDTDGLVIRNNTVLWNKDTLGYAAAGAPGENSTPRIDERNSVNVEIYGNIAPVILVSDGVDISDNGIVSYDQKGSDEYLESNFVNATAGSDGDFRDYRLLPDSIWSGVYGAAISQPTAPVSNLTAVMTYQVATGDFDTITFDAQLSRDETGLVGANGAEFVWTFGDGTTLRGLNVTKTFASIGTKDVTLTVTKNGVTSDTITRHVEVQDKNLVLMDFDQGFEDVSSRESLVMFDAPTDGVAVKGVSGSGFHLDGSSRVSISRDNAQIHDLEVFSIGMAMKLDADSGRGFFLRFYQSMSGYVTDKGAVKFSLTTTDGTFTVQSLDGAVSDNDWHKIFITFDTRSEQLKLFVDGTVAGTTAATGLSPSKAYWGLDLGDSWTKGVKGVIDDFSLTATVASEGDISTDFAQMQNDLGLTAPTTPPITPIAGTNGDILLGDSGDNILRGGTGDDTLYGKAGGDNLFGDLGKDKLYGGDSYDFLSGGAGDDTLSGGAGNDIFAFGADFGADIISDFGNGTDQLLFRSELQKFDDLTLFEEGRNVLITANEGTIRLENVSASTLSADDFLFV